MPGSERRRWMETVTNEFQKSPLAGTCVFSLVLVVLEKLVELEFECPCKKNLNAAFVVSLFICPGFLAFALMSTVHQMKCSCDKANLFNIVQCIVPAVVWLNLLLFDGRYIACAMTDWSGTYVTVNKDAPFKWCESNRTDRTLSTEQLKSEGWNFQSQWAGILLLGFMGIVIFIMFNCKCCTNNPDDSERGRGNNTPPTDSNVNESVMGETETAFNN